MKCIGRFGVGALVSIIAFAGVLGIGGCSTRVDAETPSSVDGASGAVTTGGQSTDVGFEEAFRDLAADLEPVPAFGLAELPSGTTVASSWWPVVDGGSPEGFSDKSVNPHIIGSSQGEAEGQILLACGDGWLAVLANFRGDLGDVSGEKVGAISGAPAYLYEVNGGSLVQWGYQGRWYGVFGRGVPRDLVISTALSMTLIEKH
jgi:hypothetical protein